MRSACVVSAVYIIACIAGAARAEPNGFLRGTKTYSQYGAAQFERTGDDPRFFSFTTGWANYLIDNLALETQAVGYYMNDEDNGLGIGANALVRYHFLNVDRFSMHGELLGGTILSCQDFPTDGTEVNFTYGAGLGLSFRMKESLYLVGGGRFQHISNAFIEGRDHNPVFNSFGGYVGLMWVR